MGKRPPETDMAMLRLSPRSSLIGANLKARDAWSQKHGRDPRSKQQTAAEKAGQETLLRWAAANMSNALTPAHVRRGRVKNYKIDFGSTWKDFSPLQLALSAAPRQAGARQLPTSGVPAGAFLTWITVQHPLPCRCAGVHCLRSACVSRGGEGETGGSSGGDGDGGRGFYTAK